MKKILISFTVAVLLLTTLVLPGCSDADTSDAITEKKDNVNFNMIEIGSAFDFEVSYSDSYSVTISANEDLIDYIEVTQSGSKLSILLNPHHSFTDFTLGDRELSAEITMPALLGLEISGACNGKVSGFHSTSNLMINISGATEVDLDGIDTGGITGEVSGASRLTGNLTGTNVMFDVSGASVLNLEGSSMTLDVTVSGASRADMSGFRAGDIDADISGASEAVVFAENTLDVLVSGASKLSFLGNPVLGQSIVSGASTIKHQD